MFGFLNKNPVDMIRLTESDVKRLKDNHGVVLFFMNGCGHCVDMKKDWNDAVDECRNSGIGHANDDFVLGAIESGNMDMFKKNGITTNVNGYPTIMYITSEGIQRGDVTHEKYEKPRTKAEFVSWIKEKKNRNRKKTGMNKMELMGKKELGKMVNIGKQFGGGRKRKQTRKQRSRSKSKRHMKRHTRRHTRTRRQRSMKGGGCGCGGPLF